MVSRNYDLSQTPSDSILIFPDVPASPPSAGSFLGAVTSSAKLAQLGFFAPSAVYIPIAGGTMTGPLILSGDPTVNLGAATKQYTDKMLPLAGGQMSGALSLFGDATQPLHAVTFQQLNTKLNLAGGTMTGNLFLNANPGSNLQAATKQYVDAQDTAVTAAYLPLIGGVLTGPVTGTTFAVPTAVWSTSTEPDIVWSIRDGAGNVSLAFSSPGVLTGAVRLLADPVQLTDAATKRYVDQVAGVTGAYLPLVGGTLTGALTGTTFAIPTVVWSMSTEPDLVWSIRDGSGNIAVALSPTGVLNAGAITTPSLALTGPLTAPLVTAATATFTNLTATASATMAGDIRAIAGTLPDLVGGFEQDATGGIVKGYSSDGVMHVVGLAASNSITLGGTPITALSGGASGAPADAIDAGATAYGAKGDGAESYAYATTSGTSLTLVNYSGALTLSQLNPTTALLTLDGAARWSGWAPQPSDIGKTLYLTVGAYTLTATVQKYIDGQTLWLNAPGITAQTSVAGAVTLPAFLPTDVSKSLVVEGMGQNAWWSGPGTFLTRVADTATPYGMQTFITTIATVVAPNQVTTSTSFPFSWTSRPTRLMWGTNDGNAAALAANDAFYGGKRKVWFSGDNKLYLLLGLVASGPGGMSYTPTITNDATALLNGVIWGGDNARVFACNGTALQFPNRISQSGALATREAPKLHHGRLSFPRCAQLSTINVLVTGDSLGTFNPQSQNSGVMNTARFQQEFKQQNPGKTINFYNIAIGGKTFADLTNPAFVLSDVSGFADTWNIPRPIAGTIKYIDLFSNINRTTTSATNPIVPDLVVMFDNGGNDAWAIDGASIQTMVNLARRAAHTDSFGPADVIMQTDYMAVIKTWSAGISGGVALGAVFDRSWYNEFAYTLIRTTANNYGFGCVDLVPLIKRAAFGYDPTRRTMRQIPSFTLSATPTTPVAWPVQCRDFAAWLSTPSAATDAAAWTSIGQLDMTLSEHQGCRLMLRMGSNGNLWLGQSAYGGTTATVTTLTSGSKTITFAAPVSFPGVTARMLDQVRQLGVTTGIFTSLMNGQSLVAPIGATRSGVWQPQRTYIRQFMDANNVMLYDCAAASAAIASTVMTITIGGQQFIPQDGTSMPDVVVFYPDGTVWNTQVDWNGYISATSATLVDAAPQSLAGVSVPVFLGRMGIKWYDTGLRPSATTNVGVVEIGINRGDLTLGYAPDMVKASNIVPTWVNRPIERLGGPFNPVFRAQGTQDIQLTNLWVDSMMPYAASCTAWELRGIADANSDYAQGGVGGHYGSRFRPEILDPFYATQNFSTG